MEDNTKGSIIQTFLTMSERIPVEKISVSKLMNESEFHRETFYYYFDDKNALIEETLKYMLLNEYVDMLTGGESKQNIVNSLQCHRNFYKDIFSSQSDYMFKRIYCRISVDVLQKHLVDQYQEKSAEIFFATKFYAYAVNNILYEWIDQGMIESDAQVLSMFRKCLPEILIPYFK